MVQYLFYHKSMLIYAECDANEFTIITASVVDASKKNEMASLIVFIRHDIQHFYRHFSSLLFQVAISQGRKMQTWQNHLVSPQHQQILIHFCQKCNEELKAGSAFSKLKNVLQAKKMELNAKLATFLLEAASLKLIIWMLPRLIIFTYSLGILHA